MSEQVFGETEIAIPQADYVREDGEVPQTVKDM